MILLLNPDKSSSTNPRQHTFTRGVPVQWHGILRSGVGIPVDGAVYHPLAPCYAIPPPIIHMRMREWASARGIRECVSSCSDECHPNQPTKLSTILW